MLGVSRPAVYGNLTWVGLMWGHGHRIGHHPGPPCLWCHYNALLKLLQDIGTFDVEAKKTSLTKDPLEDGRI